MLKTSWDRILQAEHFTLSSAFGHQYTLTQISNDIEKEIKTGSKRNQN